MNKLLSVIILTKNEEQNISNAINSIKKIAGEIIVIDDNSIDQTSEIAEKLGAKVYQNTLVNFSEQRNFGLKKAKGVWVLFLDSDEVVSQSLGLEVEKVISRKSINGYYLKRSDNFLGKQLKYGEAGNLKLLRLGKKDAGDWDREVHEAWQIKGNVGYLKNHINHYSHDNIQEFINSINRFSSLHAESNRKEGKKSSLIRIVVWPTGKFIENYFFKLGFLDGTHGFVYAVMMSLHSFLAWSKQWTNENK